MLTKTVAIEALRPGGEINSRTSNPTVGVKDLVESIKTHGLLQPLICDRFTEGEHEVYRVVDGNRRFAALKKIHGKKTTDVPIVVIDGVNARETSLVANVIRADIHPIDEYRAYAALVAEGVSDEDIAKRFNKKVLWIRQRLGLAALAPELQDLWLKGKLSAEQAEALTLAPSHDVQSTIWRQAATSEWNQKPERLKESIRRAALCDANDPRLIFIGHDAYRDAGGTFRGDLFTADQYPDNIDLLNRLVHDKANGLAARFREEGWKWVEISPADRYRYRDADWRDFASPDELAAYENAKTWPGKQKVAESVEERAETDPEVRARYGVVCWLSSAGELQYDTLQMTPEEWKEKQIQPIHDDDDGDDREDAPSSDREAAPESEKPRISVALTETLSEVMTVALSKAVAAAPNVALSMLLATLKVKLTSYHACPVMLSGQPWRGIALERDRTGDSDLDWVAEFAAAQSMDIEQQIKALSGLVASLIDLRQTRNGTPASSSRDPAATAIASALFGGAVQSGIKDAFDPATYFDKVPAALIDEACAEMSEPAPKGKKKEKVEAAAALAREYGWLPPELRTIHYAGPGANHAAS